MNNTAIEAHNLSFSYGTLPVLENVSFAVPEGSYTALIGANGAGKSTLLKLLLGELTPTAGTLSLLGTPIRSFREWPRIGYVPQGTQAGYADFPASVSEVVSAGLYKKIGLFRFANAANRREIARALSLVGMDGFEKRPIGDLSGGQRQRIAIARGLMLDPDVVIADEPVSALDVSVRLQVLGLLDDLVQSRGLGLIFISHDINLVRSFCDRVLVMYAGRVVESIAACDLDHAQHPYTQGLFGSLPDLNHETRRLSPIDGLMPDMTQVPEGCKFAPRCPHCTEQCRTCQPQLKGTEDHSIRCHLVSLEGEA